MQGKRLLLVAILLIVVLFGAAIAVKKLDISDEIKEQETLVEQADAFIARELYIRGIPLYKQAMAITTTNDNYLAIQKKLVDAYYKFGETSDYVDLVNSRINENTAYSDEYLNIINYYLSIGDSGSFYTAMNYVKLGMERFDDTTFDDLYETYRYNVNVSGCGYTDLVPTSTFQMMPATNGELWGYQNNSDFKNAPMFEEATCYNTQSIAMVKWDGQYYTINTKGQKYSVNDGALAGNIEEILQIAVGKYFAVKIKNATLTDRNGSQVTITDKYTLVDADFNCVVPSFQYDELTGYSEGRLFGRIGEKWYLINGGFEKVTETTFSDVAVNSLGQAFASRTKTVEGRKGKEETVDTGIAMVKESDGLWYAIDVNGNHIIADGFADAKAPEGDNAPIAVANQAGMWGYININGEQIIDFQYYDAYSFSQNVGAVMLYNDEWSYVSEKGNIVIQSRFVKALPFHNGNAFTVEADGTSEILSLVYSDQ